MSDTKLVVTIDLARSGADRETAIGIIRHALFMTPLSFHFEARVQPNEICTYRGKRVVVVKVDDPNVGVALVQDDRFVMQSVDINELVKL